MINELPESLLSQIIFFPEPHRNCDCFIITAAVTEITFSKHPTRLIPCPSSTAAIATPSQNGVSSEMDPPLPAARGRPLNIRWNPHHVSFLQSHTSVEYNFKLLILAGQIFSAF